MKIKDWFRKLNHMLVPIVFLMILAGGGLWHVLQTDRGYSERERRLLAQMPDLSVQSVFDTSFMSDYEVYLSDQFPMRDEWITLKAYTGLLLGQRETGGVYIAKDQSLIELHRDSDLDAERYRVNTEALAQFACNAAQMYGASHVRLMLVPTAEEIWSEKLPESIRLFDQSAYLQEITERLEQTDSSYGQMLVNTEAVLRAHREEAVYYKTDHHWSALGAYYGYVAYAESLLQGNASDIVTDDHDVIRPLSDYEFQTVNDSFCGTTAAKCGMYRVKDSIELIYPLEKETYVVDHNAGMKITDSLYDMEQADGIDPYAVYLGGNDAIVTITNQTADAETKNRHLLIIRDSYANCFVPYLTSDYGMITLIDLRYYNGDIYALMEEEAYTDVLVLYNIPNLITERTVYKMGNR